MDEIDKGTPQPQPPGTSRKPYAPPSLTLFGHVATLTQSVNCSATSDAVSSCGNVIGGNMGMS